MLSFRLVSQSPFNRKLLVNGTREPVAIYQLNGEHGVSTAFSEFVNTTNVEIYGCKSEGAGAVLMVVNSTGFASYVRRTLFSNPMTHHYDFSVIRTLFSNPQSSTLTP